MTPTQRRLLFLLTMITALNVAIGGTAADDGPVLQLDRTTHDRCVAILREGLTADDFWPSIHAAEGLTLGGHGEEVIAALTPKLATEADDQRRCGLSRELVRAGQRLQAGVMLEILVGNDPHGHVHAAESLYKVEAIGDGSALRKRFETTEDLRLKLMAAGALGRCGNPHAMAFIREMLHHDDPELFKVAAWLLGRIGDESDIPRLQHELPRCREELTRAYFDHSLAALSDDEGLAGLRRNLTSADPAVRTYAATFAGDARDVEAGDLLIGMLDDPHLDARYRAAQSLLVLASPIPPNRGEDVSRLVYESTPEHPRYTEGSILELADGSLLFAVTQFSGSGSDFAKAQIIARRSSDGGRTWGEPRVLQENTGGMNVMSVTLRRLDSDRIALFYLQKNSVSDLDLYVRFSEDEAQTFGEPVLVTGNDGYHVVNNDRIVQLSRGRLLAPAASTPDVQTNNHFVCHCYLSDDGGATWRDSIGRVDAPKRGAMEPEVIELTDGRVMMLIRTQMGTIGTSYSSDGGETWSELSSLGVQSPEAPATVRRVPSTGDLLLIWNNTYEPGAGHGGQRTPLTAAISADEGANWRIVGNLEEKPDRTYSYSSLTFVRDRAVLSYWDEEGGRFSCRFRSLPVSWLYR